MKKYILSIDQGTTSSRVILFDNKFNIQDIIQEEFTQYFPRDGWVEHDAIEIWRSVKNLLKNILKNNSLNPYPALFVIYNKITDSIKVTNMVGPLKHLQNKWFFRQKGNNSEVDFHVDFELKNKILNLLMIRSFDIGLKKIAVAFEKRAIELFKNI